MQDIDEERALVEEEAGAGVEDYVEELPEASGEAADHREEGEEDSDSVLPVGLAVFFILGRVFAEFRRHGIPYIFFTSVYSVFLRNCTKFRGIPCHGI